MLFSIIAIVVSLIALFVSLWLWRQSVRDLKRDAHPYIKFMGELVKRSPDGKCMHQAPHAIEDRFVKLPIDNNGKCMFCRENNSPSLTTPYMRQRAELPSCKNLPDVDCSEPKFRKNGF